MHIKKSSWIKHFDFILADLICLNITFNLAYWLRHGIVNVYEIKDYRMIMIMIMVLHFCITYFSNWYSGILKRGYFGEFQKVFIYNLEMIAVVFSYLFVMQLSIQYSRLTFISYFCINTIVMYMVHIILKKIINDNEGLSKYNRVKILVLVNEEMAVDSVNLIKDGHDKTYDVVGIAIVEPESKCSEIMGIPVVAYGKDVYEYVCHNVIDDVLICMDPGRQDEIERVTNKFLEMGVTVHVKMNMFTQGLPNVYFGRINAVNVLTTSMKTVQPYEIFLKRALDICAGIVGCLITAILFIFIAPAIKIADPKGPVFFGQERVGKNGRKFKIYKFRSMYSDAEERKKELMDKNKMSGLMFKIDADLRIIGSGPDGKRKGLGHFLRASSLDEFPNFWSILKGDMSLVGTRPPTMDEYEKYELHHKSRLAAKPGLTGIWQVSGRSDFTDFEEVVKLDNEYIKNWTIGLDIKIILKTVVVVIARRGSV